MWVFAVVAQLVEQHIRNVKVASSIPANGTKYSQQKKTHRSNGGFFFVCGFAVALSPPACAGGSSLVQTTNAWCASGLCASSSDSFFNAPARRARSRMLPSEMRMAFGGRLS